MCGQPWTLQAMGSTLKRVSDSPSDGRFLLQLPSPPSVLTEDSPPPRGPRVGGPDAPSATDPTIQRVAPSGSRGCGAREPWVLSLGSTRSVGFRGGLRPGLSAHGSVWRLDASGTSIPGQGQGQVCSHCRMTGVRPRVGRPCQKINANGGLQSLRARRNKRNTPPEFTSSLEVREPNGPLSLLALC